MRRLDRISLSVVVLGTYSVDAVAAPQWLRCTLNTIQYAGTYSV
jgi:hypothetical protein